MKRVTLSIRVERVGGRIHLSAPYSSDMPARCKSVPGARWSARTKTWTYALDWGTCIRLRETFGQELQIGPALTEWARDAKAAAEQMRMLAANEGKVILHEVERLAPNLAAAMRGRSYQNIAAKYIEQGRSVLLGDQPGMGKTLETIGGIIEAGVTGPILVFCPSTAVHSTWERELRKWVPQDSIYCATGTKKQRQDAIETFEADLAFADTEIGRADNERVWLICNIEMARVWIGDICPAGTCKGDKARTREEKAIRDYCPNKQKHREIREYSYPELFRASGWAAIVVDESHKALICHAATLKKMTQVRAGMALLPLRKDALKLALSGTPWRGKPKNFWGTLNWLRPEVYTSYWRWVETWFDIFDNGFGKVVSDTVRNGLEDAFAEELRTIMIRRTKAECLPDLPPKQYVDVWLPMEGAQKKAYDSMVKEAAARIEGGSITANGVLPETTRLKQFAGASGKLVLRNKKMTFKYPNLGIDVDAFIDEKTVEPILPSNKFDWIVEFLAERGIEADEPAGTSKVVIASQFTALLNLFAKSLRDKGIPSYVLTGETPAHQRAEMIANFQSECPPDHARVFFLNTYAGGVSVTLDAADDLVLVDRTWIPDNEEQVEDRIHRASRMHQVTIWNLGSEGTIEEQIVETNMSREEIQKVLMDGTRGVEYLRKLLEV